MASKIDFRGVAPSVAPRCPSYNLSLSSSLVLAQSKRLFGLGRAGAGVAQPTGRGISVPWLDPAAG